MKYVVRAIVAASPNRAAIAFAKTPAARLAGVLTLAAVALALGAQSVLAEPPAFFQREIAARGPENTQVNVLLSAEHVGPDGRPFGAGLFHCTAKTTIRGSSRCEMVTTFGGFAGGNSFQPLPGRTYSSRVQDTVPTSAFVYGPRRFTYGSGGKAPPPPRYEMFAPGLPSSNHYTGRSIKQSRLGKAAYKLSKLLHVPKTVAVACWSVSDWTYIDDESPESAYSLLGFWNSDMPRWLHLSPQICRSIETLLYHRPAYPNAITANGIDTLTHEMLHALGSANEARTECFAMQLSAFTSVNLGVPAWYASRLSHMSLGNYHRHPPAYVDDSRCRENGTWDLSPGFNSLPWHNSAKGVTSAP